MDDGTYVERLRGLHAEWRREPAGMLFRQYVARSDARLFRLIAQQPQILADAGARVQAAWQGRPEPSLDQKTIEKYMSQISAQVVASAGALTLKGFINKLLQECATEEELQKFLGIDRKLP